MTYTLIIQGRLDGLNEYTAACRSNAYLAAKTKRWNEDIIHAAITACLRGIHITRPVYMRYRWYEVNMRRDKDNIAFGKKFIQDALVQRGVLAGDGWKHIVGFSDDFAVDKQRPRVEVSIEEVTPC